MGEEVGRRVICGMMSADIYGSIALIFIFNYISLSFLFMELEERKGRRELRGGRETLNMSLSQKGEAEEGWRRRREVLEGGAEGSIGQTKTHCSSESCVQR